jgi:DNA-binding ferritin-like protein (Dps family)
MKLDLKSITDVLVSDFGLEYFFYPNTSLPNYPYCVRLKILWRDKYLFAWGTSSDLDFAVYKAIIELLERMALMNSCALFYKKNRFISSLDNVSNIVKKHNIASSLLIPRNSNGTACDFSTSKAFERAKNELIERHVILSSFLVNQPPQMLESNFKLSSGLTIQQYFWKSSKRNIVVAFAHYRNGFLFGYSCAKSMKEAQRKASEEIIASHTFLDFQKGETDSKKLNSIIRDNIESFAEYWLTSGDKSSVDFFQGKDVRPLLQNIPVLDDFYYCELPFPAPFDEMVGSLKCIRVISPQAQQLFFDHWKEEYINKNVIRSFCLPSYPHIIS